jgi:molecular chaperone Hsp33
MAEPIGAATIQRSLDPERLLSLASGDFGGIFAAYEEHVRRWELPLDGLSSTMMRQGLAALGLHLVTRPNDESCGVTINIQSPPLNLFFTGDARDSTLTGRAFHEDVQTAASSRIFVQSVRPRTGALQSTMDVQGLDVLAMFEDYYARSEQFPARFVALDCDRYGLVQGLPDGGRERIAALTPEATVALFASPLDFLQEHTLRFRCGCNPDKIVRALRVVFDGRDAELFQSDAGVEAFCPRCGARWWITREEYEATPRPE